jgi:hypothetical protein
MTTANNIRERTKMDSGKEHGKNYVEAFDARWKKAEEIPWQSNTRLILGHSASDVRITQGNTRQIFMYK